MHGRSFILISEDSASGGFRVNAFILMCPTILEAVGPDHLTKRCPHDLAATKSADTRDT